MRAEPERLGGAMSGTRDEVAAWLDEHWDPDRPLREWRELLADSGWGCPTWPREWFGRGLSERDAGIVREELATRGAVGTAGGSAIVAGRTDDRRARLRRREVAPPPPGHHR